MRAIGTRVVVVVATLSLPLVPSLAVPAFAAPAGETRFQGARLAFAVPAGWKVREVSEVATEHAVELVVPAGSAAAGAHLRVLVGSGKTNDGDIESAASVLRDARLRNRASWGVKPKGERRAELGHVGSRRSVRLIDQMSSTLGASVQVLLCISAASHLICGVADGAPEAQRAGEAVVTRALETIALAK